MNFSSMDYFIMLVKERSFTKAADRLHITQQTLSAHIAGIEQELGSTLLLRRIPLELTYAGQVFLQYALDVQRKLNSMEQEFIDISSNQKGVLRIGVSTTRGHAIMPPLIEEFQKQYPQIAIRLIENSNDKLRKNLDNGEIDLAIANFPEAIPGIELVDFYQEQIVLLVPRGLLTQLYGERSHLIVRMVESGDLSPLGDCPFLLNSQQDIAGRIGYSLLSQVGIIPTPKAESYNLETLLALCVREIGACFCPENLMKTVLSSEQISKLKVFYFKEDTHYMIRFGYLKRTYQWTVISNFIDLACQLAPIL